MMGRKAASTAAVLAFLAVMWLGGTSAPAHADEDEAGDRAQARALLQRGDQHIERGDRLQRRGRHRRARTYYERALESYQKAYELVPKDTLFFAIAGAEEKLGRFLDAVEHYQQVIDEVDNRALQQRAAARIAALSAHVAVLYLDVLPRGAEISVDRKLRGSAPLARPIYLAAGDHQITVTAAGYSPFEATLVLEKGQTERRTIELAEVPVLVKTPRPMDVHVDAPPVQRKAVPAPSRTGVVVGIAVTAVLAAGATTTGILALSRHDALHDDGAQSEDPAALADSGRTLARVTDGLAAGAILIGAYTTYQYFADYRPRRAAYERSRAAEGALWILPHAHRDGGGLAVGGRF